MEELLRGLRALAEEKRLKMLELLLAKDFCVGALARHLGISEPAVSQHLRILREAGFVQGEKRGYWTHYRVRQETIEQVAAQLMQFLGKPSTWNPCEQGSSDEDCCQKGGEMQDER